MFIDFHLISDVHQLAVQTVLLIESSLILDIKLETLIFEVISFFHHNLKAICQGIVDELIFQYAGELLKEFGKLAYFDSICFDELFLVAEDGLLECVTHLNC